MKDISIVIDCYEKNGHIKEMMFSTYDLVQVSNEAAEHIKLTLSDILSQLQDSLSKFDNNLSSVEKKVISESIEKKQEEPKSWWDNMFDAVDRDIADQIIAKNLIKKALHLLSLNEQDEILRIKPYINLSVNTNVNDLNKKPM